MQSIILSIGDELALGQTVDTNSAWLAERLSRLGISTLLHETIADDLNTIVGSIRWASERADLLIITGGLGPTEDDLTRQALAEAMGVPLVEDPVALRMLESFFQERGYNMAKRNAVQAMHPQGSFMIPNGAGTAPGIAVKFNRSQVFVTPGVPREMKLMFSREVEPAVRDMTANSPAGIRSILTTKINTFGMGESDVAERLGPLMQRDRNPTVGTTVSDGICGVRIRAEYDNAQTAEAALEDTASQVRDRLGEIIFGRDDESLQQAVVSLLLEKQQTVATAESCTGGLIGAMLTDVPGSSAAYLGGWVTYTNALKQQLLGVPDAVIEAHGAVSEQVVIAMAEGARQRADADLAVAVSGIAGPDGGTADKPVGTVWLALATRGQVVARLTRLSGSRQAVRDRAAKCALQMIRLQLLGKPFDSLRWLAADASAVR